MARRARFTRLWAPLLVAFVLASCGSDDESSTTASAENNGSSGSQQTPNPGSGSNPTPQNTPPTLSGSPPTSVVAGSEYVFKPTAKDADGDILQFAITNRPSWASFDASTGELRGIPRSNHVGTYANIVISVTDGEATSQLAPFSIRVDAVGANSATLTWTAPTQRTDGSPLTDLAGYKVYWGRESRRYTQSVNINNPAVTAYVVENLGSGTYYFATTAVTTSGLESAFSNEATKTIP